MFFLSCWGRNQRILKRCIYTFHIPGASCGSVLSAVLTPLDEQIATTKVGVILSRCMRNFNMQKCLRSCWNWSWQRSEPCCDDGEMGLAEGSAAASKLHCVKLVLEGSGLIGGSCLWCDVLLSWIFMNHVQDLIEMIELVFFNVSLFSHSHGKDFRPKWLRFQNKSNIDEFYEWNKYGNTMNN